MVSECHFQHFHGFLLSPSLVLSLLPEHCLFLATHKLLLPEKQDIHFFVILPRWFVKGLIIIRSKSQLNSSWNSMSSVKRGFKINALNQQNKRSNNISNLPAIKASVSHNKIKTRTIFWLNCDTPECSYQNIKTTFRATFVLDIYDTVALEY